MDTLVAEFEKNSGELVRIRLNEFKGKRLVDTRVFYKSETGGEPQPTKKGISLRVETVPDLIAALEKAVREAHEAGFTNEEKRDAA